MISSIAEGLFPVPDEPLIEERDEDRVRRVGGTTGCLDVDAEGKLFDTRGERARAKALDVVAGLDGGDEEMLDREDSETLSGKL